MSRKSSIFIYVLHRPGSERVAPVHTGVNSISRVAAELTAQNGPDQTAATLACKNTFGHVSRGHRSGRGRLCKTRDA